MFAGRTADNKNGLFPSAHRTRSKGLLTMWTSEYFSARLLIWLSAVAISVQGLPAESCGCMESKACCRTVAESKCCCCRSTDEAQGECCSSRRQVTVADACCRDQTGRKSGCTCGPRCKCEKSKEPQPTAPPNESNRSTEKVASDAAAGACITAVVLPKVPQQQIAVSVEPGTVTALDRCVSLCRFTL